MSNTYIGRHRATTPDLRTTILCALVALFLICSPFLIALTIVFGVLAEAGAL